MRRLQALGKIAAWPCEPLERAMGEKSDIRGMHLTWRLIVEVPPLLVTVESWA
jgi:hypothetical protein